MKSNSEGRPSTVFLFYFTSIFAILQLLGSGYHEVKVNELPDWDWAWSDGTKAANWGSLAWVASVSNRVIRESYWERKQKKGWRGMGRGEEETFVPLSLPRHSFFFCSCPSFLDEPREETLATQARGSRKGYVREYFFSFLPPYIPHLSMHLEKSQRLSVLWTIWNFSMISAEKVPGSF